MRKFNAKRAYNLVKFLVIGISAIAGVYAVFLYNRLSSNAVLYEWQNLCNDFSDEIVGSFSPRTDCMIDGYNYIDSLTNYMWISGLIAVLLPLIFFGGSALFRFLFPVEEKED